MLSCRRLGHRRLPRGVRRGGGRTVHGVHGQGLEEQEPVLALALVRVLEEEVEVEEEEEVVVVVLVAVALEPKKKKKRKVCVVHGRAWILLEDCKSIEGQETERKKEEQ